MWTNEQIRWAWQQAITVEGYDPNMVRKDACGAWIVWGKYGHQDSPFGWEVDHIFPKDKGGDERPINLRAMQHANNAAKGNALSAIHWHLLLKPLTLFVIYPWI